MRDNTDSVYSLGFTKAQKRDFFFWMFFGPSAIALGILHFAFDELPLLGVVWIILGLVAVAEGLYASSIKTIVIHSDRVSIRSWFGGTSDVPMSDIVEVKTGRRMKLLTRKRTYVAYANLSGLCRMVSDIRSLNPTVDVIGL